MNGYPFHSGRGCFKCSTREGARPANEEVPLASDSEFEATVTGLDNNTPLDEEAMTIFMDKVINEVVDMPIPTEDRNEQPANSGNDVVAVGGDDSVGARQRRPAARRIELENLVSFLTNNTLLR
ncbi:hypothetical protein LINPERHAP2_LOCUS40329 [Linum perenne]